MAEPELLSLSEVAIRLGLSAAYLRQMVRDGRFPSEIPLVRLGERAKVRKADLDAFLGRSLAYPADAAR